MKNGVIMCTIDIYSILTNKTTSSSQLSISLIVLNKYIDFLRIYAHIPNTELDGNRILNNNVLFNRFLQK